MANLAVRPEFARLSKFAGPRATFTTTVDIGLLANVQHSVVAVGFGGVHGGVRRGPASIANTVIASFAQAICVVDTSLVVPTSSTATPAVHVGFIAILFTVGAM
jgi:hypothetical protein